MFWLLLLPIGLAFWTVFGILFLPFAILRAAIKLLATVIVLPLVVLCVLFALLVAGIAFSLAILVPLLPLAFVAFCLWAVVQLASRPKNLVAGNRN